MSDFDDEKSSQESVEQSATSKRRSIVSKGPRKRAKKVAAEESDDDEEVTPKNQESAMSFGTHLNFIVGRNGSGKSAIVAAVQLCLGATARTTGRGSQLAKLIREGSDGPAIVQVTLLNNGPDSYKKEVYGDKIIIERKISRTSGGGYSLYAHNMVKISTEKKELQNMLRNFNIYVDNPCCVLTQEDSKKFIQGHDRDKYEFFLKASGLFHSKQELQEGMISIKATADEQGKCEEALQKKNAEVKELKRELKELLELGQLEEQINECKAKIFWHHVLELESILKEQDADLSGRQETLRQAQADCKEAEDAANNQGTLDDITAKADELRLENETVSAELQDKQAQITTATRHYNVSKNQLTKLAASKVDFSSRLETCKREIQEQRAVAMSAATGSKKGLLDRLESVSNAISKLQEDDQQARTERGNLVQQCTEAQHDVEHVNQNMRVLDSDLNKLQSDKKAWSGQTANRAAMFGDKMPALLNNIAKERFHDVVVGPIGMHVKLRDGCAPMGQAVEKALGRVITAFIVTNMEDSRKLSAMMKQMQFSQSVFVQPARDKYNIQPIEGVTMLDAVTVESDLVYNVLVDQARLDTILVCTTEDDCMKNHVARNPQGHVRFKYQRVKKAIAYDGTTIYLKNGNSSSEVNRENYRHLLAKDSSEVIAGIDNNIQQRLAEKSNLQVKLQQHTQDLNRLRANMQRVDNTARSIAGELRRRSSEKGEVQAQLSELEDAGNIDTSAMEAEADELYQAIQTVQQQIDEQQGVLEIAGADMKTRQHDKTTVQKQFDAIQQKILQQQMHIEAFVNNSASLKQELRNKEKIVEAHQKNVAGAEKIIGENRSALESALAVANEKTPELIEHWDHTPVPLQRNDNPTNLNRTIKIKQKQLDDSKALAGLQGKSVAIVTERYQRAKDDFDASVTTFKHVQENLANLEADYEDRHKLWKHLRKSNATKVAQNFDEYMQSKGFAGTVNFDHVKEELHLQCQTDNRDELTASTDVRNLSGGERSYCTFCLLLALGHVIDSPFRLMDEYDVFLDEHAREVTLKMLKMYAMAPMHSGRQFLVITPHNVNSIVSNSIEQVRVQQMPEPVRNSAHGLQQQTL